MNELRRRAYLEAVGVTSYVSRRQLPGAARSRRVTPAPVTAKVASAASVFPVDAAPLEVANTGAVPVLDRQPRADKARGARRQAAKKQTSQLTESLPRFSLAAIVAGHWLWLEDLAGMPLATEQVRLVHSMARALVVRQSQYQDAGQQLLPDTARPDIAQFDWPIHTNRQLDLGIEAARASVAGFVGRKLEQHGCRGLVLLGASCTAWVPTEELGVVTVCTTSSAEILADPALKCTVWGALLPLASQL